MTRMRIVPLGGLMLVAMLSASARDEAPLTLEMALRAVLEHPQMDAARLDVQEADAMARYTGRPFNPEMELEQESSDERTFWLRQSLDLGPVRSLSRTLARQGTEIQQFEMTRSLLDQALSVRLAFVAATAAQEKALLARELATLANSIDEVVRGRVEAGKVSPQEALTTRIELDEARLEQARAEGEVSTALSQLALAMGRKKVGSTRLDFDYYSLIEAPQFEAMSQLLSDHPLFSVAAARIARQRTAERLAAAGRFGAISIGVGYRRDSALDESSPVFGVSVPLNLFRRNQGERNAARLRGQRAEAEQRLAEVNLDTRLAQLLRDWSLNLEEARSVHEDILPLARKHFEATREGYNLGKFGYLDVLQAWRTLFTVRHRHVEALRKYHEARMQVAWIKADDAKLAEELQ